MNRSSFHEAIETEITKVTGQDFSIRDRKGLGGGCINETFVLEGTDGRRFFIKSNTLSFTHAFKVEAKALKILHNSGTIRVPRPLLQAELGTSAVFVMEFLPIGGGKQDWERMGRELAHMHKVTSQAHGWEEDNFIGATPQPNGWSESWPSFYSKYRLQPQINFARKKGLSCPDAEALIQCLPKFFLDYVPEPSLLHGDLWAGNAAFTVDGTPVIYDPSSYYGDRETDIAMTEMFGGFPAAFYEAYNKEWQLHPGYSIRRDLYQLYHVLNHYNLFGGGYGSQAQSLMKKLLLSS